MFEGMFGNKKVAKSVDSIMSTFNETISNLKTHAAEMDAQAIKIETEIVEAKKNLEDTKAEANKAIFIAGKLDAILGKE